MNQKVKDYIDKQPSPQKEICTMVRKTLLATIPESEETFKNGVPWYGKFYIVGLKDSVNIGFSITGLDEDEIKLFKGKGKFMRHIKMRSVDDFDGKEMKKLFDKLNLEILSMGMSNDYLIAIEEGSNMVRIGTLIFGERKY